MSIRGDDCRSLSEVAEIRRDRGPASGAAITHTNNRMSSRIKVFSRVLVRRHWTAEKKHALLRHAFGPNSCVRTACERYDFGSGSISHGGG